jgi:hypothetical protein
MAAIQLPRKDPRCRVVPDMIGLTADSLDRFRQQAELTHGDLWVRYFELGGMSTGMQLEALLYGALQASRHDHDVIALALNERFVELGRLHLVPYVEDQCEN